MSLKSFSEKVKKHQGKVRSAGERKSLKQELDKISR